MSFQYKIFPELRLKHGVEKTINDPVSITSNGNREIRRKVNKTERYSWTIPARNLMQDDMQAIIDFSRSVVSSQHSFLYRDPTMPELVDHPLTKIYANGTQYFALYHSGLHPVINMEAGGPVSEFDLYNPAVIIKRNGVVYDKNSIDWLWNKKMSNLGRPDLPMTCVGSAYNWGVGDTVTFTGPIFHTVRLDSMISYRVAAFEKAFAPISGCDITPTVSEMADIKLIEVFEYSGINE